MSESITAEVRKFIRDKIERQEEVRVAWVTNEFINTKCRIEGDDVEFYRVCAHQYLGKVVRACVGKYDPKGAADDQIVLPGFHHLQVAYSVTREDDVVLVPTDRLSDAELLARADELREMAKGCLAHAAEIEAFVRSRPAIA